MNSPGPADLQPILCAHGLGTLAAMTPLDGGGAPVFRLDRVEAPPLVLKLFADAAHATPGKEAAIAAKLLDQGIPVPRPLVFDATRTRLPFAYALIAHLPGRPAGSLSRHPDAAGLHRQTGAMLARMHAIAMPAYGAMNDRGEVVQPQPSNPAFIAALTETALAAFAQQGGPPGLARQLAAILAAGFDAVVPHSIGPVLAHNDLHPNNVLALETAEGKLVLSGIVDFGSAHAADPVFDLAKCLFCSEHDAPGSGTPIRDGYGPIPHPRPDAALAYYTVLHRLVMWGWLRRFGVIPTPDAPGDLIDALRRTAARGAP